MLGLRQRIAFAAVLLIGVVPSGSKAFTIEECYAAVEGDYANCIGASLYPTLGQCENRMAQQICSAGTANMCHPVEAQKTMS